MLTLSGCNPITHILYEDYISGNYELSDVSNQQSFQKLACEPHDERKMKKMLKYWACPPTYYIKYFTSLEIMN